jgi:hypothetical protein
MRQDKTVARIILLFSIANVVLAAPALVRPGQRRDGSLARSVDQNDVVSAPPTLGPGSEHGTPPESEQDSELGLSNGPVHQDLPSEVRAGIRVTAPGYSVVFLFRAPFGVWMVGAGFRPPFGVRMVGAGFRGPFDLDRIVRPGFCTLLTVWLAPRFRARAAIRLVAQGFGAGLH